MPLIFPTSNKRTNLSSLSSTRQSTTTIVSRPLTKSNICNRTSTKAIWQNITAKQHWTTMQLTQICRIRLKRVLFSISTSALRFCTSFQLHRGEGTQRLKAITIHTRLKIEVSSKEVEVVIAQSSTRTTVQGSLTTSNTPPCSISKGLIKLWWQPLRQRLRSKSNPAVY